MQEQMKGEKIGEIEQRTKSHPRTVYDWRYVSTLEQQKHAQQA
ncbi:hypothetical protein [Bacillus alveayuensis]|jgi:hypothetical protein|nr:hypothetical protein [Bacillus alveayuensis]